MKYCKFLSEGINFHLKGINFCNKLWKKDNYIPYEGNFLENFLNKRDYIINSIKNNNFELNCSDCIYLCDIDSNFISNYNKIKTVEIYHWEECNCACFYCSNRNSTRLKIYEEKKYKGKINIIPYLKKLKEKDLLDENVFMLMSGGEPTLLEEFSDLLNFFIDNNYSASILSNGIIYECLIPKLLISNRKSCLTISLDSGCRETYKKIKNVDKFDVVVENIKKYIIESKDASDGIVLKYIILEGVNDNKEEIDKWINLCAKIGVKKFLPSIEFCHSINDENKVKISEHICELYDYLKISVKKYNSEFEVYTYDFVETFIKNRSYKIK